MANIRFIIRNTDKELTNLHVRVSSGTEIDIWSTTKITIQSTNWDAKREKLRQGVNPALTLKINNQLTKLKSHLMDQLTMAILLGHTLDNNWLRGQISTFLNKPKLFTNTNISNHCTYFFDFMRWWMQHKSSKYIPPKTKREISKRSLDHYNSFINMYNGYEKKSGRKQFKDMTKVSADHFRDYMKEELKLAVSTINRNLARLNFFINRARDEGIAVPDSFRTVTLAKEKDDYIKDTYFNEAELTTLYNHDFSGDCNLDLVRDHLIISCYTGLRVSDFLTGHDRIKITEEFIEVHTKKTGALVTLPIKQEVKEIMQKYGGKLPPSISDIKFNKLVKVVAKSVGFTEVIYGRKRDSMTNRKRTGYYPRHELISSHIGRKSFATNYYGKIPTYDLMQLGGWKSEKVMLNYIKTTGCESARTLLKHWEGVNS